MSISQWTRCPIGAQTDGFPYQTPRECAQRLVDITDEKRIYYSAEYARMGLAGALERCYVREEVALMLRRVLELLPADYFLWIYDTLRPVAVQKSLYDLYWKQLAREHPEAGEEELRILIDDFVAYPRISYQKPAPHTTGGAVDLTLGCANAPLPMGTDFDDLTDRAHTRYYEEHLNLSAEEKVYRDNRRILYYAMTEAGFVNYRNEWWHYAFGDRAWGRATGRRPIYSYIEPERSSKNSPEISKKGLDFSSQTGYNRIR